MDSSERIWRERGLLAAVLAGDERAWQTWYEETFDGLYAYAYWLCGGNRDRTDETVQETWLTVVRRIRAFDPERGSFAGWVRGIATNVLRNQRRHEHVRGTRTSSLDADACPCTVAEQDPTDRAERVSQALAALPERYEAVLRAKYLEQKSVAEIADAWSQSSKAIESLLSRARQAFREAYSNTERNHEPAE